MLMHSYKRKVNRLKEKSQEFITLVKLYDEDRLAIKLASILFSYLHIHKHSNYDESCDLLLNAHLHF